MKENELKRLCICAALLIGLQAACTADPGIESSDEPDRPSPTETVRTDDLQVQIESIESVCTLLEAERIKKYFLEDEYVEPRRISTSSTCNDHADPECPDDSSVADLPCDEPSDPDCPDSNASIDLSIHPEANNIEAVERFNQMIEAWENPLVEGEVGTSGSAVAYAAVHEGRRMDDITYSTDAWILGEFYVVNAHLVVEGGECMPDPEELGTWLFEKYAPTVVEGIESRIDR